MKDKAVLLGLAAFVAFLVFGKKGAAKASVMIPSAIVPPANPLIQQTTNQMVAAVFQAPQAVSGLDANGKIVDFERFTAAVATAHVQAGDTFVVPINASDIRDALGAVIGDPRISDMPVLVGSSQLDTPPQAFTTGVILPGGTEGGLARTEIIFPISGGWPDVTLFPNGTQIILTGAGYVAVLPA